MTTFRKLRPLLAILAFLAGVAALTCVVLNAGASRTFSLIVRALPLLPVVAALEACRIGTEVMASRHLFAMQGRFVPSRALVRAHLVGYATANVLPVGRVAAEATKAGLLAPYAGLPSTAAVGAVSQALQLMASALILIPGAFACRASNASVGLFSAVAGQCLLLAGAGTAILVAAYAAPATATWIARFPRLSRSLLAFRSAIRSLPRFPAVALVWLTLGRVLQVALIAVLTGAVGASVTVTGPFIAEAVLVIGATVGDVVPGQVGAYEAAFGLFAGAIGLTKVDAVAVALLVHLVQACWTVVGFGALFGGRARINRPLPGGPTGATV